MSVRRQDWPGDMTVRPLTKQEIDDTIHRLVTDLIAPSRDETAREDQSLRPCWITADELVRRISRYLSYN